MQRNKHFLTIYRILGSEDIINIFIRFKAGLPGGQRVGTHAWVDLDLKFDSHYAILLPYWTSNINAANRIAIEIVILRLILV